MRGRIRRGVRVRRVVRRLELWSVFKIGLLFHLISGIMSLAVGVGLWTVASQAGMIEKLASFLGDLLGTVNFQIDGVLIFRGALPIVGALVVVNVIATVVLAFVYNMLSGIFGGLVISVLQEIPKPGTVAAQVARANGSTPQLVPATRRDRKAAEAKVRADEKEAREAARRAHAVARDRAKGARAVKVVEDPSKGHVEPSASPSAAVSPSFAVSQAAPPASTALSSASSALYERSAPPSQLHPAPVVSEPIWARSSHGVSSNASSVEVDETLAARNEDSAVRFGAPSDAANAATLGAANGSLHPSDSDPAGSWMVNPGSGLPDIKNG